MIPMYLYHYTSIENLKNIIESKGIIFNCLAGLNDPYEGIVDQFYIDEKDYKKKLVYVSCWNDQEEDSLILWQMYTNMEGVRIKMEVPLFTYKGNAAHMGLDKHKSCHIPVVSIDPITIIYESGLYPSQYTKLSNST